MNLVFFNQYFFSRLLKRFAVFGGVAAAATVLLCPTARASYYLQDGFNYPTGNLGGNSPWADTTSQIAVVNTNLISIAGLADFSPSGNAALVAQNGATNVLVTYRPFDGNLVASNGSVYFSLLIEVTNIGGNYYIAGLMPPSTTIPTGAGTDPCDLISISATGGYELGIRSLAVGTVYASTVLPLNTVVLVVMKYNFSTGIASLYLNPTLGGTEPVNPSISSTGATKATSLDHLFVRMGGSTAGDFFMDTLRVASTWAEVTPITGPEATKLTFASPPSYGATGVPLDPVVVQLCGANNIAAASNNVPVTVSLNTGSFASGTTTLYSDAIGQASFNDLVISTPGIYTLTASASGIGTGLSPVSATIAVGVMGVITPQGYALSNFLNSLNVAEYWAYGVSVNWLTGASNGPAYGANNNMTQGTASHCSAFAGAVTDLLGVYLLRQPYISDMGLADNQANWLATNNAGWTLVDSMTNAQGLANLGQLVVASYYQTNGSGHIAVLRPTTKAASVIMALGPEECQSGDNNYNDTNVSTGFNVHPGAFPNGILYYWHVITNPIVLVNPTLGACSLSNGDYRCSATTVEGRPYKLQGTSDFVTWNNILSFTNLNTSTNFWCTTPLNDTSASGSTARFYRLLAQ